MEEIFVPRSGWQQFYTLPKHEMENVHPKYNADATLAAWQGARLPGERPAVLTPWVTISVVGDKLVSERNPLLLEGGRGPPAAALLRPFCI